MQALIEKGRVRGIVNGETSAFSVPFPSDADPERLEDYVYYQGQITEALEGHKTVRVEELNRLRETILNNGFEFTVGTDTFQVQTRPEDRLNLVALRIEAKEAETAGVTDSVFDFRSLENSVHWLTPAQLLSLCDSALTHMKEIYRQSWTLKDQVETAATLTELRSVVWVGVEDTDSV